MNHFRSPSRGSNVVHRLEIPGLSTRRARRLIDRRRAEAAALREAGRGDDRTDPNPRRESAVADARPVETASLPAYTLPGPSATTALPSAPRATPSTESDAGKDAEARKKIELLERRIAKMSRLLEERDQETISRTAAEVDAGVASIYREVQGIQARGKAAKQKSELMSRIFEANLKLRERVTSVSRRAE